MRCEMSYMVCVVSIFFFNLLNLFILGSTEDYAYIPVVLLQVRI